MDEDLEETMTPMVDALTGATSAVILISIFLLISTVSGVSESIKKYATTSLYKNRVSINDVLKRHEPTLLESLDGLYFYDSYKLSQSQIVKIGSLFKKKFPRKLIIESNKKTKVATYNIMLFLRDLGLISHLDSIEIVFEKSPDVRTYIRWE
jgi:hypothetical protein